MRPRYSTLPSGDKHRGLRRHGRIRQFDQLLPRIEQQREAVAIFLRIFRDHGSATLVSAWTAYTATPRGAYASRMRFISGT